mgnify:CR=1 FL=1
MTDAAVTATKPVTTAFTASVIDVLDQLRKTGPLQTITFPPFPELLARLQVALAQDEPDLNEVGRIATADVAMSVALIKAANSPLYAAGQPVQTIGQALNRLGLDNTAAVMMGFLAQRAIKINSPQLARFWERASKRAVALSFMAATRPSPGSRTRRPLSSATSLATAGMISSVSRLVAVGSRTPLAWRSPHRLQTTNLLRPVNFDMQLRTIFSACP